MKKFVASKLVLKFVEKTSRISLAALLQQADCLLANDAGPLHLAASPGTSVVDLFTCTSPQISGYPGADYELVSSCVDCHASYRKCCPNRDPHHLACMEELSIEQFYTAVSVVPQRQREALRAA